MHTVNLLILSLPPVCLLAVVFLSSCSIFLSAHFFLTALFFLLIFFLSSCAISSYPFLLLSFYRSFLY